MANSKKVGWREILTGSWEPYWELLAYAKPYKSRAAWGILCGMSSGAINGMMGLMVLFVTQAVFPESAGSNRIIDSIRSAGWTSFHSTLVACSLVPAFMVARGVLGYLNTYCMTWVGMRMLRDMRAKVFRHLLSQSLDYFNKEQSGKLISRVLNETRAAQASVIGTASDFFKDPFSIIVGITALFIIDWKFCLTTVALFPVVLIPIAIFGGKVRKAGHAEESEAGMMGVILQETFAGIRVVKSFARESFQVKHFDRSGDEQFRNAMRVRKSMDLAGTMVEILSAFGVGIALIYVHFSGLTLDKFLALLGGIVALYQPIKSVSRAHLNIQKAMAASTNIFKLLRREPTIKDSPEAAELLACAGKIEFDKVTFSYNEQAPALSDIDLVIEPGRRVALVGSSGAGKSTLLSLMMRFYDPQEGVVRVDDKDIKSLKQDSLRSHIGLVAQETFLFHDTIRENIRFGRLEATDDEIEDAARQAFAHDFILRQPDGYDTIVGDKGCMLSGGQQQRIAIARALLKNAPILLLDEATSALDSESEKIIQSALEHLSEGRTVVAIAHRLSTILRSDEIIVMDHGRIIEKGTHRDLLERSPIYRKLYELQFLNHDEEAKIAA